MKAVIVAGGTGTRLYSLIGTANKHLLPIGKEFVITKGVKCLATEGINEFLIITNKGWESSYQSLFDADPLLSTLSISIISSGHPKLPLAEIIFDAKDIIDDDEFILLLGDNVFIDSPSRVIKNIVENKNSNNIVLARSDDVQHFGVPIIRDNLIQKVVEKPKNYSALSHGYVVTGLAKYTKDIFYYSKSLFKNDAGHRDLTAIHNLMIKDDRLSFTQWDGEWFDIGTIYGYRDAIKKQQLSDYSKNIIPNKLVLTEVLGNPDAAQKIIELYQNIIDEM